MAEKVLLTFPWVLMMGSKTMNERLRRISKLREKTKETRDSCL